MSAPQRHDFPVNPACSVCAFTMHIVNSIDYQLRVSEQGSSSYMRLFHDKIFTSTPLEGKGEMLWLEKLPSCGGLSSAADWI